MKKGILAVLILSIMLIGVGCSKNKPTDNQNDQGNVQNVDGRRQFAQTPENKLRRTVMQIQQLERNNLPISKEQAQKLIAIITEVKTKDSIDQTYADKKTEEINNIFTADQKKFLEDRQNNRQNGPRQGNNGQNGQTDQGGQQNNQVKQPRQRNNQGNGPSGQNGGNGAQGQGNGQRNGFQQGNAKDFYDQIIKSLQEKVK